MSNLNEAGPQPLGGEGFYKIYVTVIYGLLVSIGLDELSSGPIGDRLSWAQILLFAGTFISSVHFWMVCISSDTLSDSAYLILEGGERSWLFNFLFVLDVTLATAFAGCILSMFRSAKIDYRRFFWSFVLLAALSLVYDVGALCLAAYAGLKTKGQTAGEKMHSYVKLYGAWLTQDALYVLVAVAFFWSAGKYFVSFSVWLGIAFAAVATMGLILDVVIWHPSVYRKIQAR